MEEKPINIQKTNTKTKEKFPLWSTKWRPTVFRCPKTPKTIWAYPRWEMNLSLVGQKIQDWARYEQVKADNMIFIHVNFQDLQQKQAGVRLEVQKMMGMGKILETNNEVTGTMTYNILLTRFLGFKGEINIYLHGMGSRRTRTVDAMGR